MAVDPLADWQPRGVDLTTLSTARMYDYYLGGKDNFAVDREAAERALATPGRADHHTRQPGMVEALHRGRCAVHRPDHHRTRGSPVWQWCEVPTSPPARPSSQVSASNPDTHHAPGGARAVLACARQYGWVGFLREQDR